jgi:hypothetical protein
MNKIITTLAIILTSNFAISQTVFDKYDDQDGVTSIIVNNKMFELMSKVNANSTDKEAIQYNKLLKKLDNLKVFVTASLKTTADMKATAFQYLKTAGMEELMHINKEGKNIKIYVKQSGANGDNIKELFMFIEGGGKGNETVILSLTGDFDINEIAALTDKMNLPGGDELKKASKKQ